MDYKVQLDIFEGPMDLLVHLVRKNDLDIYNIPIAFITGEYLEYVKMMQMLNIDFAGDFLLMASTLSHIKSRMLLPYYSSDDEEDPRMDIVRPLLEYMEIKSASEKLLERDILGEAVFKRENTRFTFEEESEKSFSVGLFELVDAFNRMMENCYEDHNVYDAVEEFSVKDMIPELISLFIVKKSQVFTELFKIDDPKKKKLVVFLAILEMTKKEFLEIRQNEVGIIRLYYKGPQSITGDEVVESLEELNYNNE